jgi:C4-dicarboxylate transporter DctQ subunit
MILRVVNALTKALTVLFLSLTTVMVAVEVVLRYGFGRSLYVTEELTRYLMVWVVFLACSLAVRDNAHISIEIVVNRLSGRARAAYKLVAQLFLLAFLAFLIAEGILALPYQLDQIIPTLEISIFWFYLAIPVGGALMALNLLPGMAANVRLLLGKDRPQGPPAPATPGEQGFL